MVVTYNSTSVIADCLRSLPEDLAEIIVVDNASADDTLELVARHQPHATVIRNQANVGFGRANNLALRQVSAEFALLVNPDARVDAHCIRELVNGADRFREAMILAPLTYNANGVSKFSYANSPFRDPGHFLIPEGDICAEFVSGAVMLLRMRCLNVTGLFDENIFMYWEDQDLCLRARKHGYSCISVHTARAYHGLGVSAPTNWKRLISRERVYTWSYLYLYAKYRGAACAKRLARGLVWKNILLPVLYGIRFKKKKLLKSLGRVAGARDFLAQGSP